MCYVGCMVCACYMYATCHRPPYGYRCPISGRLVRNPVDRSWTIFMLHKCYMHATCHKPPLGYKCPISGCLVQNSKDAAADAQNT